MEPETKILLIVLALLLLGTFLLLPGVRERKETADCLRWQEEAEEYEFYYLLKWQDKMCSSYKMEIDAPIY